MALSGFESLYNQITGLRGISPGRLSPPSGAPQTSAGCIAKKIARKTAFRVLSKNLKNVFPPADEVLPYGQPRERESKSGHTVLSDGKTFVEWEK